MASGDGQVPEGRAPHAPSQDKLQLRECWLDWSVDLLTSRDAVWCRSHLEQGLRRAWRHEQQLPARSEEEGDSSGELDGGDKYPVDIFFEALLESRRRKWSWELVLRFFQMLVDLLEFERARPLLTMEQSFERFKQILLLYSCERPPWTIGLFSQDHVVAITEFALTHHYRHFDAHKRLMLSSTQHLVVEMVTSN